MSCGPHAVAAARRKAGISAWRYLYSGDWPNTDIGVRGAWHMAEIPMVFGTTEYMSHIPDTEEEKKLGQQMRLAWTGFAKDPTNGLVKMGWPVYDAKSEFKCLPALQIEGHTDCVIVGPVIRLGAENNSEIAFEPTGKLEAACPGI